ncbi:NADH-quinone oxidoreductase subunit I [Candidatus Zixiibacteriota bacterium]|nr:NADH-quinone oxidoreductase subunit I [candidate division Zixibacteria bacterium]
MIDVIKTVFLALPKGFYTTLKHLFMKPVTIQYPKVKKEMAPRYRGLHYLEVYEDGSERCVCCGLCAASCPADAIYMEGAENEKGERYAKVYEINLLRCIYCGYCEEACPEEAIFLGHEYEFSNDNRDVFIFTKEQMLANRPKKEKPFKKIIRRVRRIF